MDSHAQDDQFQSQYDILTKTRPWLTPDQMTYWANFLLPAVKPDYENESDFRQACIETGRDEIDGRNMATLITEGEEELFQLVGVLRRCQSRVDDVYGNSFDDVATRNGVHKAKIEKIVHALDGLIDERHIARTHRNDASDTFLQQISELTKATVVHKAFAAHSGSVTFAENWGHMHYPQHYGFVEGQAKVYDRDKARDFIKGLELS